MNRQNIKRITAVLIAFIVAMAVLPATSYAKTVKAINITSGMTWTAFKKKAPSVTRGTTTIKVNKKEGYVKFKATATKTYTFTIDNLKLNDDVPVLIGLIGKLSSSNTWKRVKTRSNEGVRNLWFITNSRIAKLAKQNKVTYKLDGKNCKYLAKRFAKVALKKGQVVYLDMYGSAAGSVRVNIK